MKESPPAPGRHSHSSSRYFFWFMCVLLLTCTILLVNLLLPDIGNQAVFSPLDAANNKSKQAASITAISAGKPVKSHVGAIPDTTLEPHPRSHSETSASIVNHNFTDNSKTTQPLYQQAYLDALTSLMEKDGRDNALLHYAMAFEIAPPQPTDEQARLIQQILDEGWDERAEPLLPYLLAWQKAFDEIEIGSGLDYAKGVGFEMGPDTPIPNFLSAQNAAKMLAVYSRYLESQGNSGDALKQLDIMLTMGRDFNSPDNLLITNLIGTAIENRGLTQLSRTISNNELSPGQLQSVIERLQYLEQEQPTIQSVIDAEMQISTVALSDPIYFSQAEIDRFSADPELYYVVENGKVNFQKLQELYKRQWASESEKYSILYQDREHPSPSYKDPGSESLLSTISPNFEDAEVRFLNATSRLRLLQIDAAVQLYIKNNSAPPPNLDILAKQNYLSEIPLDPFAHQSYKYNVTGSNYDIYGSGPNISINNNPEINWSPVNGIFSEGVIRE